MSKRIEADEIQLRVLIDGSPARKELAELGQEAVALKDNLKGMKKGSEEAVAALARMGEIKDRQAELRKEIGLSGLSLKELQAETGRARAALRAAVPNTEQWVQATLRLEELKQAQKEITDVNVINAKQWEDNRRKYSLATMSTAQLALETQRLKAIIADPATSAEDYDKAAADLQLVTQRTKELTDAATISAKAWERQRQGMSLAEMTTEELAMETKRLQAILANPNTTKEEYLKTARSLELVKQRTKELTDATTINTKAWELERQGLKLTQMNLQQLGREADYLKVKMSTMGPNDANLVNYRRQLTAVQNRMRSLERGLGPFGRAWQNVKTQVASGMAVVGAFLAGSALVNGVRNLIKSAGEYSDALADVRKTTGLTTETVKQMSIEMGRMDTRTPRSELLQLARDAGKLGLSAREDVMAFVRAGNQIRVALGEELGDDAIKNIGKLVDIFKLQDKFGLEQGMLKMASAVNELGMSSTASEGYMVEFLKRMGGIAPLAGITADQTLALGATLDSLGQTSEVSSTALSKLFIKMASNAGTYSRIAGMEVTEFTKLMKENALEAFIKVLDAAKTTDGGIVELAGTLGDLGVEGGRAVGVLGVLSQNTQRLREQMVISKNAFEEGSSITNEYNIKNTNLAATLSKLQREFRQLVTSNKVLDFVQKLAEGARDLIAWLKRNADAIAFVAKVLATATAAWVNYRIVGELWAKRAVINAALTRGLAIAQDLLSFNTVRVTNAFRALNTAMRANLFGFIAGALTTIIGLFISFGKEVDAATESMKEQTFQMRVAHAQIIQYNLGTKERTDLIKKLQEQHPELLSGLKAETVTNQELAGAIELVNKQLIRKSQLQKMDEVLKKQTDKAADAAMEAHQREAKLLEHLTTLQQKYGIALQQGVGTVEQAKDAMKQLQAKMGDNWTQEAENLAFQVEFGYNALGSARLKANEEEVKTQALLDDRTKFLNDNRKATEADARAIRGHSMSLKEINQRIAELNTQLSTPGNEGTVQQAAIKAEIERLVAQRDQLKETGEEVKRTIEEIDAELKELKERRDKESSTKPEYDAFTRQIEQLERERARITGEAAKGRETKNKEDLDKLLEQYRQFAAELSADQLEDNEREIAKLDQKHTDELKKLKEQQKELLAARKITPQEADADLVNLGKRQTEERANLISELGDKRLAAIGDLNERIQKALGDQHNAELKADVDFYAEQIREGQAANQNVLALEEAHKYALLRLYEQNALDLVESETKKWDEIIRQAKEQLERYDEVNAKAGVDPNDPAIAAERKAMADAIVKLEFTKDKAIRAINAKRRRDDLQAEKNYTMAIRMEQVRQFQNFATAAESIKNVMGGIMAIQDAGIRAAEERADADGVRTDAEVANINRLKEERRKLALVTIAVETAAAIASGVAQAIKAGPWPANMAAIASTVATVFGLMAQAKALINSAGGESSSPNTGGKRPALAAVPLGAEGLQASGGKVKRAADGGTVLNGPGHAQGGMAVLGADGRPVAEVEGGELMLILSRAATSANADLIPAMLRASKRGERMSFLAPPPQLNTSRASRAMRVMRDGGALGSTGMDGFSPSYAQMVALMREMVANQRQMAAEQQQATEAMRQYPTKLKATLTLNHEYDRTQEEWSKLKKLHSAGKRRA